MPRIKSAKKRQRQTKVRSARNKAARSSLRTAIKKVQIAPAGDETVAALKDAQAQLDRAGRKNLMHRNTANRTKSRLAKQATAKAAE